ncbi:MAG TPA: tetratricopeptide repeat protein [Usitatibacteraceae bacterium]|nr:tetratricopeptide repeat protein [Usitatibacteraceae bacterium]
MQVRHFIIALALAAGLATGLARAGPAEDYTAGDAAYRRGDVRSAIASLRKAADAGHAKAQVLLGSILEASQQDADAARYLALAADQGDAEGAYLLATLYSAGQGVDRDPAKARQLLEKAAAVGHRDSVFAIATAYLGGGLGLADADRASAQALAWIRKAADGGHLPSLDRLALAYRKGELGLTADAKMAEELEARARSIRGITAKPEPARKRPVVRMPGGG